MEETKIVTNSFMSPEINEISAALSAFQGGVEQPKLEKEVKVKTKAGYEYKFKYADLYACVKSAAPALKEHGLSVSQIISDGKLITLLSHKSGQWMKSELLLPTQTSDYQAFGSAITYLKRYSYCAILGIVADTDDDANMACGNQAELKDRKVGKSDVSDMAFTGEQLAKALSEIEAATTEEQFNATWNRIVKACPALGQVGTEFYNKACDRINVIKKAQAAK